MPWRSWRIQTLQGNCSFQQKLDESKGPSQPLETSWAEALHEPRAETPLVRATGRKWSRMKGNPFWSPTTAFSHIWNDFLLAEGRENKPPALGCMYLQQNCKFTAKCNATESFILAIPEIFTRAAKIKINFPACVCYPHLSCSFVATLPEHINAFKKLISHKLLLGHVLRR